MGGLVGYFSDIAKPKVWRKKRSNVISRVTEENDGRAISHIERAGGFKAEGGSVDVHSMESHTIPARVGRLQLKPSKCPLRMRSPIGDGARLTGFLGGLFPLNGGLRLVGLLGSAVFGGTAGT